MGRLGTDVMALACILGSAGVAVAATAFMEDGRSHSHVTVDHAVECAVVEDTGVRSDVVVTMGAHKDVIVVAQDVRRHQPHCVTMESIEWTEARQFEVQGARVRMEQARMEMEMARELMELRVIDLEGLELSMEGLEMSLEGMDFNFEFDMGDEISEEIEQTLKVELQRLEEELKRLEEIGR